METATEHRGIAALRDYVLGETSEPVVISAFRDVPPQERVDLVSRLRGELQAIDGGRLLILESMLLPLDRRSG